MGNEGDRIQNLLNIISKYLKEHKGMLFTDYTETESLHEGLYKLVELEVENIKKKERESFTSILQMLVEGAKDYNEQDFAWYVRDYCKEQIKLLKEKK